MQLLFVFLKEVFSAFGYLKCILQVDRAGGVGFACRIT